MVAFPAWDFAPSIANDAAGSAAWMALVPLSTARVKAAAVPCLKSAHAKKF
jgi:hypothetical protein